MKKILYCLLLLAFLVQIAGCAAPSAQEPVLPPTRTGSRIARGSLERSYTFEEAMAEADVVAHIRVGDWIAEDTDNYGTYYKADVLQRFKGEIPDTFTLRQTGCSTGTIEGYPLFTNDNELVVFLFAVGEDAIYDYESLHWIIGAQTTIFYVSYDKNGNRYYADWFGLLGESMEITTNYMQNSEILSEINASAAAKDPLCTEILRRKPYIFSEADVITLMNGQ